MTHCLPRIFSVSARPSPKMLRVFHNARTKRLRFAKNVAQLTLPHLDCRGPDILLPPMNALYPNLECAQKTVAGKRHDIILFTANLTTTSFTLKVRSRYRVCANTHTKYRNSRANGS